MIDKFLTGINHNNFSPNINLIAMKKKSGISLLIALIALITMLITSCTKDDNSDFVTDVEGNTYAVVTIGNQVWMSENLKTTKYNDGSGIPMVTDDNSWGNLDSPGYCWYDNDEATYKDTYGALYNWYAVNTGKLCPAGWHVPSHSEWTTLTDFLGGESVAGGKIKETGNAHWINPNTGATNESGFTALPGGARNDNPSLSFGWNGHDGYWWASTSFSTSAAHHRNVHYSTENVLNYEYDKNLGLSVRCVKD